MNIGRKWKASYGVEPLAGVDGRFGNPFVIGKDGDRAEVLAKYKPWLHHGTEVVNGYDPKEYRRRALEELPAFHKWGCHCAPEPCHGDILLKWLNRQIQIQRAHRREAEKKRSKSSSTEGGDTE